jgi:hypothetical protein
MSPRLDLQLDPDVAVVEVALDGRQQFVGRVVDADAHPARDVGPLGAEELGERLLGAAELRIEDRHLDRSLGHRVPVQLPQCRCDVGGLERTGGLQAREQVMNDHVLGPVDVLGGVAGLRQRNALAPPLHRLAPTGRHEVDAHEQDVAGGLAAEARAERGDQRHRDPAQLDVLDRPTVRVHDADPIT